MPSSKAASLPIYLTIIAVGLLFAFAGSSVVNSLANNDTATFNISVSQIVLVDINPNSTVWGVGGEYDTTGIYPGNITTAVDFEIMNIGSVNITYIDADTTNPSSNPFATDTPSLYDAGNYIQISNDSGSTYFFVDMLEFNESKPTYLTVYNNATGYGRFRVATNEYFWSVSNNTNSGNLRQCANQSIFTISQIAHTKANTGDINLTNNPSTHAFILTYSGDTGNPWGIGNVTLSSETGASGTAYCVAANQACTQARLFRWNKQTTNPNDNVATACANDFFIYNTAGTGQGLRPGERQAIKIRAAVPYGVPDTTDATMTVGTLTISASNN